MNGANRKAALQQVSRLLQLAQETIREDEELAQRYVAVARRIAMASRVRIPREHGRQLCRGCKRLILPGLNCRVRIRQLRESHVVTTCGYCGEHMRRPLKTSRAPEVR